MNLDSDSRHRPNGSRALLPLLALFAASVLPLQAANYYVDYAAGSDGNTGAGTTAAWKHCPGDPAATAVAGATSLTPGDTVTFKGGVSYVFTGSTGIALRWNGAPDAPITYDGNSAGTWGAGRAKFTSNYAADVTAFSASSAVSYLTFKNLEVSALGGSATLPADSGAAVAPRFGGGLAFPAGLSNATIDNCVFSNLGYAFNQKPMAASSLAGTAIKLPSATSVAITNCDFSKLSVGIDFAGTGNLSAVTVTNATFRDGVVWPFDLPAAKASAAVISGCTESNNTLFDSASWTGYGSAPRTVAKTLAAGSSVTLTASSIAIPSATYQWQKNGQAILGATGPTLTFPSLTSSDAATYTALATNGAGSTLSNDYVLTVTGGTTTPPPVDSPVLGAPVFATHPLSQTVVPGTTIVLNVTVSGSPTPTVQWFRDGVTYGSWAGASLILYEVSAADAGNYTAVATNSAGTVTSNSATLTVGTTTPPPPAAVAPAITTQPASQTVNADSNVTFTVAASGSPTPTIQWFRNDTPISGATDTTLSLNNVAATDAGNYAAVATNSAGSATSATATLTVNAPSGSAPVITAQPTSHTVAPGTTITLNVSVSGSPAPTVQWFRDGITYGSWAGTSLILYEVSTSDAGNYTAVATNSAGTVTSNPATLTVGTTTPPPPAAIAPAITTQPASQTIAAGGNVTFSVAASGTPAPTFQWLRNGTPISGATGATLSLTNVAPTDAGSYAAVATNSAGSATSSAATLTVNAPTAPSGSAPVITSQPTSETVAAGTTIVLNVAVSGSPAPTVQWFRDGITYGSWSGTSLILYEVSAADAGNYTAVATNSAGSVTSNPATLTVGSATPPAPTTPAAVAPAITHQPLSQTVANRSTTTFSVAATGTPAPTYKWFRNGIHFPSWTTATITLPDVTNNDSGTYTVEVSNSAGTVTSNPATLNVVPKSKVSAATAAVDDAGAVVRSRLVNLSVRANVGAGDDALIVGFVVSGDAGKSLLVRGSGPALTAFGVPGALADPSLALFSGHALLAANDDWSATGVETIAPAAANVGAFAFAPASRDAALLTTLEAGAYTGQISAKDAQPGTALIELYDAAPETASRLVNVSVRTAIAANGDAPVIGFVVSGTEPKKLLVRAIGPALADFGVSGVVTDPKLELFSGAERLDGNDNWSGSSALVDTFSQVGAFPLSNQASKDAALIVTAAPGDYTVVVSGANGAHGAVLVEVYELP